ncbi:TPM domain-containing protein [Cardiobacteriaceae bacterium TAE3-ERU3]|nr:TPM domain-containing protein [Cardiobacteriaceae bacterium TAE3-ERU3]
MRRGLLSLLWILCAGIAWALPAKDVPTNLAVADMAGVMSAEQKENLESQLRQMNNSGYMQAAVVIVPSTDGVDLFDYGMSLADRWQLGDAEKDNGLLLIVAINDRKLRFFQGYGLEGELPDIALKGVIRDEITPYFKRGEYAQGISAGMNRIAAALNGTGLPLPKAPEGSFDDDVGNDYGIVPFILVFAFIWARGLSKRFGKLPTWLGLSAVGSGLLVAIMGFTLYTAVLALFLSTILFVITLVAAAMPMSTSSGQSSGRHMPGGFGGGHSSGRRSSGGGHSSYRGGGGGFGGGGAGGSW